MKKVLKFLLIISISVSLITLGIAGRDILYNIIPYVYLLLSFFVSYLLLKTWFKSGRKSNIYLGCIIALILFLVYVLPVNLSWLRFDVYFQEFFMRLSLMLFYPFLLIHYIFWVIFPWLNYNLPIFWNYYNFNDWLFIFSSWIQLSFYTTFMVILIRVIKEKIKNKKLFWIYFSICLFLYLLAGFYFSIMAMRGIGS